MGLSRQEYRSGLPFPISGDLPDPGIKPTSLASPALVGGFFTTAPCGKPMKSSPLPTHSAILLAPPPNPYQCWRKPVWQGKSTIVWKGENETSREQLKFYAPTWRLQISNQHTSKFTVFSHSFYLSKNFSLLGPFQIPIIFWGFLCTSYCTLKTPIGPDFIRSSKVSPHGKTPHSYLTPSDYNQFLQLFPIQEFDILELF